MFCSKCGKELEADAVFCHSCGKKVVIHVEEDGVKVEDEETRESCRDSRPGTTVGEDKEAGAAIKTAQSREIAKKAVGEQKFYVPDKTFREMFLPWGSHSRLNRWRYFKRSWAINVFFILLDALLTAGDLTEKMSDAATIMTAFLQIPFEYWLDIRRLKDLGKSTNLADCRALCGIVAFNVIWTHRDFWEYASDITASQVFVWMAVIIDLSIYLYLLFSPGNKGENQYGPDPLGLTETQP